MTKVEAVSSEVAETNAQQVSGDDVALTVHHGVSPRGVEGNMWALLNMGRRIHHLMARGLRCGSGLGDVIVIMDDVAGVDIAAHHAVFEGRCRFAARVGALHGCK